MREVLRGAHHPSAYVRAGRGSGAARGGIGSGTRLRVSAAMRDERRERGAARARFRKKHACSPAAVQTSLQAPRRPCSLVLSQIIYGPPGTGKTSTLVEAAVQVGLPPVGSQLAALVRGLGRRTARLTHVTGPRTLPTLLLPSALPAASSAHPPPLSPSQLLRFSPSNQRFHHALTIRPCPSTSPHSQLLRSNPSARLLMVAPSNSAADQLMQRLIAAGHPNSELFRVCAFTR